MMNRRSLILLLAGLLAAAGFGVAAPAIPSCDAPDPALAAGPPLDDSPTAPVRTEPNGDQTITLLVADPLDAPEAYEYLAAATLQPESGDERSAGTFAHPWPGNPHLVTYGTYLKDADVIRRLPAFVLENGPPAADALAWLSDRAGEQTSPLRNATPFALNTILPSSMLLWSLGLGESTMYEGTYPLPHGYAERPPFYVWSVVRSADGRAVWAGTVVMQAGRFEQGGDAYGCRRVRIGPALRTQDGTTFAGGLFFEDTVRRVATADGFAAEQFVTAGATAAGTDVPIAVVRQRHERGGENLGVFASRQRDEITIGTMNEGAFLPIAGTRADASHAAPPDAEHRLVSAGVFDAGEYRPLTGVRTHMERQPGESWAGEFLGSGGPGSDTAGDARLDIGTFDLDGAFLPLAGAAYADSFDGGRYAHQMMISAGPWAAGEFRPVVGATYDGDAPLASWLLAAAAGDFAGMRPWMASAGTFAGGYIPVAGVSFAPETSAEHPVIEEYRAGVFAASYDTFVPLAGATWSSDRTSLNWAAQFAFAQGHPPSPARVDIGTVGPDGSYARAAGLVALPGRPERYQVGAWAAGGFVPVLEACFSPGRDGQLAAGVALSGGDGRMPLGWLGTYNGSPAAGTGDCPRR